ncbi:uncharacterized protein LOC123891793 [Trifolium pratense]|uniref:uncharacterized protein LOC123891793 n=1 Tax=Trifolium pratense TaxID=57577 RepID=UPI001E69767A|nr:uncharacterized protein LOC123891793 [Trifolium pratense]
MCVFPPKEDSTEFPRGPKDTSVLTSYKSHFARYVYEGYHRLTLVPVSHGKKMKELVKITSDAQWFRDTVEATGLTDLAKTDQGIDPLVSLLGADPVDAHSEVSKTKGNHATLTYLKSMFTDHLDQLAVFTSLGDEQSCERYRRYTLIVYRMLLYFEDLELVSDYVWGVFALAFLYNGLSVANMPKWTTVTSYMTLLQAWIHAHFPGICGHVQVARYDESESAAMKYVPTKRDIIST